eukprot:TRINITY_DN9752_c0_g1_i3.p2 TRINITY_DN9752_c0_g1~~TRINITY_DN9752_c0_g1_i3.p2  ORF type:complete len:108 (-),score=7.95 TRINITY_DN9752_c0_g1_i3:54-377(-)
MCFFPPVSIMRRATRPSAWTEDGLPVMASADAMASAAAGRSGAVALWSRQTLCAVTSVISSAPRSCLSLRSCRRHSAAMKAASGMRRFGIRRDTTSSSVTELRQRWI